MRVKVEIGMEWNEYFIIMFDTTQQYMNEIKKKIIIISLLQKVIKYLYKNNKNV